MGTRSNLYKNPSISYKKDLNLSSVLQNLHAYNIATGAEPHPLSNSNDHNNVSSRKRPRYPRNSPKRCREIELDDGAMSHQDYINRRRNEIGSSQSSFQGLSEDVLGASSSGTHLVDYESDNSNSTECEENPEPQNSGHLNEAGQVKSRVEQRYPVPVDPVCVLCGRYGEYICNETEDDICSMECKAELLQNIKFTRAVVNNQNPVASSSGIVHAPKMLEFGEDAWDHNRHRWSKKISSLSTYACWKCQKQGHLPEDCLVAQGQKISRDLLGLYKRCHQIGKNVSTAKCNECFSSSSLSHCLSCSIVFCDSAGHLKNHILAHPSHQQFYSYKLRRLVKCCKSTCKVTNIKDLLACHYCFDKAFDKFYDMYTATWKAAGLLIISGSICCEDHFSWHRMNCLNANVEDSAYIINRDAHKYKGVQLSDFIF